MSKRLSSRWLIFLWFAMPAFAQQDTLYVQRYANNLVPRIFTNYKVQATNFVTRSDTSYTGDYFSTGGQNFIGAEVSYRGLTLGYNFGFNKGDGAPNRDIRVSTSFKPLRISLNYTDLKNLNYYRVIGLEKLDTVFNAWQDNISLRNVGLKIDYIVNHNKFYYSSSIAQVGRQLKSQGSLIASTGISYQDFDLRGLSDSASLNFLGLYSANHFKTIKADLGVGYAYNWVITKKWVLYLSETPNIGIQQIKSSQSLEVDSDVTVSFTNYMRAGIIYTWKNKFLGAYAYNTVTTVRWPGYNYNNNYTTFQLHFGLVLNDPKPYLMKKWRGEK
jgi:hypothetical protein